MISHFLIGLHWLIVACLSFRVITRGRPVGVSLAWLTVIFGAPFIGATFYLFFGEKRLGRHRMARTKANAIEVAKWLKILRCEKSVIRSIVPPQDAAAESLRHHAENMTGIPALAGNAIILLDNFQAVFDSLIADIDSAKEQCHLSFFIWYESGRTDDVVEALIRAAGRGVECRALADGLGSRAFLKGTQIVRLHEAGVKLIPALPIGFLKTLFVRRDLRNHRKIVTIDNSIAYTGSQNLVDPRYFKQDSGVGEWVDAIARIQGPTVATLDAVFALDWSVENHSAFEAPPSENHGPYPGNTIVQVVPSGPDLEPEAIHQLLLAAIYSARRELILTTPYFVPEESMMTALLSAPRRGVDVTLIVPALNDSMLVRYASAAHYEALLEAGVKIALFQDGLLHTKSLTIDGSSCIFGSLNLDIRSLWLNFEISLFIYDHDFTLRLRELQKTYLKKSNMLSLEDWQQRSHQQKFAEDFFRLFGPLL